MMYPYLTFANGIKVTHSSILNTEGKETIEVHFERPIDNGFQSARCVLPDYTWKFNDGFTPDDIAQFEIFLKNNAHLFFKFAKQGGILSA